MFYMSSRGTVIWTLNTLHMLHIECSNYRTAGLYQKPKHVAEVFKHASCAQLLLFIHTVRLHS
jgi:hypothetical protein